MQLGEWSDTMMSAEGAERTTTRSSQAAGEAWAAYVTYLVGLIEERRAHPKDDLISVLLSSADAGALEFREDELQARLATGGLPMSDLTGDELLMFSCCCSSPATRRRATRSRAASRRCSQFPDAARPPRRRPLARRAARPRRSCATCRRSSASRAPSRATPSCAAARCTSGDVVLNVYPSANRDADVFDDPHAFRIDRVAEPAPRVRHRAALLPRREPRPHRDPHPARGALHPASRPPRRARCRRRARAELARHDRRPPAGGVHPELSSDRERATVATATAVSRSAPRRGPRRARRRRRSAAEDRRRRPHRPDPVRCQEVQHDVGGDAAAGRVFDARVDERGGDAAVQDAPRVAQRVA